MFAKSLRLALCLMIVTGLASVYAQANAQAQGLIFEKTSLQPAAIVYDQPPSPSGGLFQSSLLEPGGSASDEWVWDDFTLSATQAITEVQWRGGYKFGLGGPVIGFTLKIYPTNQTGFEPDVAHPPLVDYTLSDNAGETPAGILGGVQTYDYHSALPLPFQASAGTKYWVQIEGIQQGGAGFTPDWALSLGLGGDNRHFRRCCNGGLYQTITGDVAFSLLGPAQSIANLSAANNSPTAFGQSTAFTATVSAGNGISYAWNFGDDVLGNGRTLTHTYTAVGSYTAIVTASNSLNVLTATTSVKVFAPRLIYLPIILKE